MDYFANIVRRIGGGAVVIAALFLLAVMMIIVSNVIYRFFGGIIVTTYNLVELGIGMAAALALGYTALAKRHVIISFLLSRFPQRTRVILGIFTSVIGLGFWAVIAWGSVGVLLKRGIAEVTQQTFIPLFPFRCLWVLALLFFCLVLLTDLLQSLLRAVKK